MNLPPDQAEPLHADRLTWAALLGRWIEFAKSAVALPDDAPGRRLRESVPDLIMLQAVWFALQHLDELDPAERALGLDRAELLIDKHAQAMGTRWQGLDMPAQVHGLIADARGQLDAARGESTR
ncbi:MAG: hypothetical protein V3U29_07675 [Phycisphaeraceae bacterium]